MKARMAGAGVAATVALMAAGCGGNSTITIHGTLAPSSGVSSVFPGVVSTTYGGCMAASPAPGTQVTVTDPSGKVIGSGTLGMPSNTHSQVGGTTTYTCDMPFTIKNVPHESRYGFQINGVPGTIWNTNVNNVALSVSSGG